MVEYLSDSWEKLLVSITLKSLGISSLPWEQKLKVVGDLWDEILSEPSRGGLLTSSQREELTRRIKLVQEHPEDYVLWESSHTNYPARINPDQTQSESKIQDDNQNKNEA